MSRRLKCRLELIQPDERGRRPLLSPGPRVMQNARAPDSSVRHDESVTTQNGERRQQNGL